jgi:alpha-ketoglutarate-dependent taurine dioxygenase
MTPLGTEIKGVQLSSLSDTQKDELALYAAERGLLVFTVVVYDNRIVLHSVVLDYALPQNEKRHHIRITPQAEVPIPARSA